jgi:beta-aspartyl-peptidase (threonine type)
MARKRRFAIAVHGGAGAISRGEMTEAREREYRETLSRALREGLAALSARRSAIDAVSAAIVIMEDAELFNAGHGAVFNHEGEVELDAALMDGRTLRAGALTQARHTKNPILVARAIMESSPHVMLAGNGADAFARAASLEMVPNTYFQTEFRRRQLARAIEDSQTVLDHDRYGTVGAVALDVEGNLAAGTSTGGITNKRHGRVGDSPIIGAGTYADNTSCAVSTTGQGEFFIRGVIAHSIAQRVKLLGESIARASRHAIDVELKGLGGRGGVIAMNRRGTVAMPFNTEVMFRGFADDNDRFDVMIFR